MRLKCTSFQAPNEWEIPKEYQNAIKDWTKEEHFPFAYRNSTMADVWFLAAMIGFKQRRKGSVDGDRVKSIPAHVFSEEQVLSLRIACSHLLDDQYASFLDDKGVHDVLYPYMVGGLDTLKALFKDNQPTYYQQKLAELVLS